MTTLDRMKIYDRVDQHSATKYNHIMRDDAEPNVAQVVASKIEFVHKYGDPLNMDIIY